MELLAIRPYMDDAAFFAGGLLASRVDQSWDVAVATCITSNVAKPSRFALACRLDKGLGADVDFKALRRAGDQAACEALGARAVHLPFLVAPHRGYASAKRPFNARLVDDWIVAPLAAISADLLETRKPDLVLGSLCLSDHVDHHVVLEAIRRSFADHAVLPWEDRSYADREDRVAALPAVIEHLATETRARRIAACVAYQSNSASSSARSRR